MSVDKIKYQEERPRSLREKGDKLNYISNMF